MSRRRKKKRLRRRPFKCRVVIDGIKIGTSLKEKQILWHCLVDLIPQLKYMHPEAIRFWLLYSVQTAFYRQLHHYRIRRLCKIIERLDSWEALAKKACELFLYTEGYSLLSGFRIGVKKGADRGRLKATPTNYDAERVSIWKFSQR